MNYQATQIIRLRINKQSKTTTTVKFLADGATPQVTHFRVTGRGGINLGWSQLYATLIAQAYLDGLEGNDAETWVIQRMSELELIEGVHPETITYDDLQYLLANLSKLAHSMLADVILADDLEIDSILEQLEAKGWDIGDPETPVDEPDPSYVESFFVEATQAMREGNYEGWWSPIEREDLSIGEPGGPGKVEPMGELPDEDEETAVAGDWAESKIGVGHRLIYLGQDRILDWVPSAPGVKSSYRVWAYDRLANWSDPLTEVLLEGNWSTIGKGHELIWLGRDLRGNPNSVDDLVLDWVPSTISEDYPAGYYRVFRVDPEGTKYVSETSDILAEPYLVKGIWGSIQANKKLVYLGGDRVLDWEPSSGDARIWVLLDREKIKNATENFDPLSESPEVEWNWKTVREGQRILNLGGDRVLTWEPATGWYRIWQYDRSVAGQDNPFPNPPLVEGHWDDIDETHELVWLGGRQVLDWQPGIGPDTAVYRIRLFDRTVVSANPLK